MKHTESLISFFEEFITEERKNRMDNVLSKRTRYITAVLEDVYQSHNISAVIRSCDCFGINDIHIIEKQNKFVLNKEIELGAADWLNIYKHKINHNELLGALIKKLKNKKYRIVATSPHGNGTPMQDFDLSKGPVAMIFGTELTGLSNEVMELCDESLVIPLYGFSESLNISVSAAIIFSHLYTKLMQSDINWRLSEVERKKIKLQWLRNSIKSADLLEKEYFNKTK